MADNYRASLTVPSIAKQVRMSRRTLERRFRAVTGDSISNKLTRMRIDYAKRLLLDRDDPVRSIHVEAGFGSERQMRDVFRTSVGMTPAAFRRLHQGKSPKA